jgi:hypothetical protein
VKTVSPLWFIAGFPIYFVLLWSSVVFMLSRLGGWHALATNFPSAAEPQGQKFRTTSARIGWTNYNNCLIAIVADNGLFLHPWLPFRMFHPPLLIPWSAFSPLDEKKLLWATSYSTTISLRGGKSINLVLISHALAEEVRARTNNNAVERSDSAWSN